MIFIEYSDITTRKVGAVVNSANKTLMFGSGLCGRIYKMAGIEKLSVACKAIGSINEGEAVITSGFDLSAKYIIHTAAPKWYIDNPDKHELLRRCYDNSLLIAEKYKLKSVAFPSIGTGIYKWPVEEACEIALNTTVNFLRTHTFPQKVYFVLMTEKNYSAYIKTYEERYRKPCLADFYAKKLNIGYSDTAKLIFSRQNIDDVIRELKESTKETCGEERKLNKRHIAAMYIVKKAMSSGITFIQKPDAKKAYEACGENIFCQCK